MFTYIDDPEINKLRLAKEEQLKFKEEQNIMKIKADKVFYFN